MTDNITNNDEPRKPEYTKGPWRVDPANNCDVQTAGGELEICSTHPHLLRGGMTPEGHIPRVNARLISASPDLLEALTWALAELRGKTKYDTPQQALNCFAKADDAIAKALGQ